MRDLSRTHREAKYKFGIFVPPRSALAGRPSGFDFGLRPSLKMTKAGSPQRASRCLLLFTKHQVPTNRRGGLCPPASRPSYTAMTAEDARAVSTTKAVGNLTTAGGQSSPLRFVEILRPRGEPKRILTLYCGGGTIPHRLWRSSLCTREPSVTLPSQGAAAMREPMLATVCHNRS